MTTKNQDTDLWSYRDSYGETVGPISAEEFAEEIKNGRVMEPSKVVNLKHTGGKWLAAGSVQLLQGLFSKIKENEKQREIEKFERLRNIESLLKMIESSASSIFWLITVWMILSLIGCVTLSVR
jgi:hypothetical protein